MSNQVRLIENNTDHEWLHIKINLNNYIVDLVGVYAPQESEQRQEVEEYFNSISTSLSKNSESVNHVITMGDFNAKLNMSRNGKLLEDFLNVNNLTQMCSDRPTCKKKRVIKLIIFLLAIRKCAWMLKRSMI